MEKKSSQIENCCENMLKSESSMMQQMMKHMKGFVDQTSKKEGENEKKSCCLKDIEKFAENMCCQKIRMIFNER